MATSGVFLSPRVQHLLMVQDHGHSGLPGSPGGKAPGEQMAAPAGDECSGGTINTATSSSSLSSAGSERASPNGLRRGSVYDAADSGGQPGALDPGLSAAQESGGEPCGGEEGHRYGRMGPRGDMSVHMQHHSEHVHDVDSTGGALPPEMTGGRSFSGGGDHREYVGYHQPYQPLSGSPPALMQQQQLAEHQQRMQGDLGGYHRPVGTFARDMDLYGEMLSFQQQQQQHQQQQRSSFSCPPHSLLSGHTPLPDSIPRGLIKSTSASGVRSLLQPTSTPFYPQQLPPRELQRSQSTQSVPIGGGVGGMAGHTGFRSLFVGGERLHVLQTHASAMQQQQDDVSTGSRSSPEMDEISAGLASMALHQQHQQQRARLAALQHHHHQQQQQQQHHAGMHPHHAGGGGGTTLAHINPPRVAMRSRSSPLLSPNSEISELVNTAALHEGESTALFSDLSRDSVSSAASSDRYSLPHPTGNSPSPSDLAQFSEHGGMHPSGLSGLTRQSSGPGGYRTESPTLVGGSLNSSGYSATSSSPISGPMLGNELSEGSGYGMSCGSGGGMRGRSAEEDAEAADVMGSSPYTSQHVAHMHARQQHQHHQHHQQHQHHHPHQHHTHHQHHHQQQQGGHGGGGAGDHYGQYSQQPLPVPGEHGMRPRSYSEGSIFYASTGNDSISAHHLLPHSHSNHPPPGLGPKYTSMYAPPKQHLSPMAQLHQQLGPAQAAHMVQWITHFVRQKGGVITAANLGSALARLHPEFYAMIKASHGGLTAFLAEYPERFSFANDPPFNHVYLSREMQLQQQAGAEVLAKTMGPINAPSTAASLGLRTSHLYPYTSTYSSTSNPRLVRPVPTTSSGVGLPLAPNTLMRSRSMSDPRSIAAASPPGGLSLYQPQSSLLLPLGHTHAHPHAGGMKLTPPPSSSPTASSPLSSPKTFSSPGTGTSGLCGMSGSGGVSAGGVGLSPPSVDQQFETEVVKTTAEILCNAASYSLKSVELANTLRARLSTKVLAKVREKYGGMLFMLERYPQLFRVDRIPKNDVVTLLHRGMLLVTQSGGAGATVPPPLPSMPSLLPPHGLSPQSSGGSNVGLPAGLAAAPTTGAYSAYSPCIQQLHQQAAMQREKEAAVKAAAQQHMLLQAPGSQTSSLLPSHQAPAGQTTPQPMSSYTSPHPPCSPPHTTQVYGSPPVAGSPIHHDSDTHTHIAAAAAAAAATRPRMTVSLQEIQSPASGSPTSSYQLSSGGEGVDPLTEVTSPTLQRRHSWSNLMSGTTPATGATATPGIDQVIAPPGPAGLQRTSSGPGIVSGYSQLSGLGPGPLGGLDSAAAMAAAAAAAAAATSSSERSPSSSHSSRASHNMHLTRGEGEEGDEDEDDEDDDDGDASGSDDVSPSSSARGNVSRGSSHGNLVSIWSLGGDSTDGAAAAIGEGCSASRGGLTLGGLPGWDLDVGVPGAENMKGGVSGGAAGAAAGATGSASGSAGRSSSTGGSSTTITGVSLGMGVSTCPVLQILTNNHFVPTQAWPVEPLRDSTYVNLIAEELRNVGGTTTVSKLRGLLKHKLGSKETIKSVPLKALLQAYRTVFTLHRNHVSLNANMRG